jgi:hypothetical protein
VLALALGFAFSIWCVGLAVSMESLRADIAENVRLLHGLEDVRSGLVRLELVILDRHDATQPAATAWRNQFERVRAAFRPLDRGGEAAAHVCERLDALGKALENLNDATQPLLAASADEPVPRGVEDGFHRTNINALDQVAAPSGPTRPLSPRSWPCGGGRSLSSPSFPWPR